VEECNPLPVSVAREEVLEDVTVVTAVAGFQGPAHQTDVIG
jgi:hypothetical protein